MTAISRISLRARARDGYGVPGNLENLRGEMSPAHVIEARNPTMAIAARERRFNLRNPRIMM